MRFVFENNYAPLTDSVAFVQCDIQHALEKYLDWINPQIEQKLQMQEKNPDSNWNEYNKRKPIVKEFKTNFLQLLELIQPLYFPQKTLLFEAKNGWVGFIENINGTEIRRITQIASRIDGHKQSIGVQAWQNNYDKKANGWCGGSFSLFEGHNMKRHIMLSDQDKWEFDQSGIPLPFEEVEKYKKN